jgi:fructokinase
VSALFCFGEILWDILPHGRFLGGAPLNVAYHLRRLGNDVRLISAVGRDRLGDEAVQRVRNVGLEGSLIGRHESLPTGAVEVTLDAAGQATYQIKRPVAWDEISLTPTSAMHRPEAFVFGSLALRGENNRRTLREWLRTDPRVRLCDLNLRPPFADVSPLDEFVSGSTLLKVNDDEARKLSPASLGAAEPAEHAAYLAEKYECISVCVTLGAAGALLWHGGRTFQVPSPAVTVRDTIGLDGVAHPSLRVGSVCGQPGWCAADLRARGRSGAPVKMVSTG